MIPSNNDQSEKKGIKGSRNEKMNALYKVYVERVSDCYRTPTLSRYFSEIASDNVLESASAQMVQELQHSLFSDFHKTQEKFALKEKFDKLDRDIEEAKTRDSSDFSIPSQHVVPPSKLVTLNHTMKLKTHELEYLRSLGNKLNQENREIMDRFRQKKKQLLDQYLENVDVKGSVISLEALSLWSDQKLEADIASDVSKMGKFVP